jgi:glutathione S-transferase
MSLVLYYAPQTRAINVLWALEELGLPYEKVKLDFSKGEQKAAEYKKINPNGKVPALVVDGTPMWETLAILLYLGDRFGVDKKLWPAATDPARVEAMTWSTWAPVTLAADLMRIALSSSDLVPKERHNAAQADAAREDVATHLGILEERLATRSHILGDEFSLADLAVSGAVAFATRLGLDLARWPKVQAWVAKVRGRPALGRVEKL